MYRKGAVEDKHRQAVLRPSSSDRWGILSCIVVGPVTTAVWHQSREAHVTQCSENACATKLRLKIVTQGDVQGMRLRTNGLVFLRTVYYRASLKTTATGSASMTFDGSTDRHTDRCESRRHETAASMWPICFTILFYCLSRYFFHLKGIRFDSSPLDYFWQIVDPVLLRTDLWESVSHLHSQPPLFNLFLGIVLKIFPGHETLAFALAYKLCGLALCMSMVSLMIRLGIPALPATAVTAFYMVSPAVVVYENFLFYEYPTAAILCIAAWASQRFGETEGIVSGLLLFSCCAVTVLLRSGFTLVWFGAILIMVIWIVRSASKKAIVAFCLAVVPVVVVYAHNYSQFGFMGTSSWLGMNLTWMTVRAIPKDQRVALAAKGEISGLSLIEPFQRISAYRKFVKDEKKTGVPLLDREFKTNGEVNLHHGGYVDVSARYLDDAIEVAKKYPLRYLGRIGIAEACFFTPSSKYGEFVDANRSHILAWEHLYNRLWCCTDVPVFSGKSRPPLCIAALVMYTIVLLLVPVLVWRERKRMHMPAERPIALAFMWFNVAYVTLVFNCVDFGENMRFRFLVEHFAWILTVWTVVHLVRIVRRPGTDSSTDSVSS